MKLQNLSFDKKAGSILFTTLIITGIIAFILASYLTLVSGQNRSVARSQNWNASLAIVEAGIEEAMSHLNKNCLSNSINPLNPNADFWQGSGQIYTKTASLGTEYYDVSIDMGTAFPPAPSVTCEGHVLKPLASAAPSAMFAQIGGTTSSQSTASRYLSRKVIVQTKSDPLFSRGMVSTSFIDLSGHRIKTDSFNSTNPASSTGGQNVGGQYVGGQYDPTKALSNGDIATNLKVTDSLSIGNATIQGHVATGPQGTFSIGVNGSVGDAAWVASHTGIQPGYSTDDMNVSFPDVKEPFSGGTTTPLYNVPIITTNITPPRALTTATNYPSPPPDYIVTNTTVSVSTTYPAAGTFSGIVTTNLAGVVTTNTTPATSVTYPSPYLYLGTVTPVGIDTTNINYPADDTYIIPPGVATIYPITTNSAFPAAGMYTGSVTTNTTSTTAASVPSAGIYLGAIVTNSVSTNSASFPGSGTYIGAVATNTIPVTSSTVPAAGTYLGSITTNATSTTTAGYPSSGTYSGSVTTNTTATTTASVPATGTYTGSVTTNITSTTTVSAPSAGTYTGSITTNVASTTTAGAPAAGTYTGSVTTNTTSTTTVGAPATGTYVGTVTTNTVSTSTTNIPPVAGTYTGTVTITYTTTNTTTVSYPAAGTYTGNVTTNITHLNNQNSVPAAGTYVSGTLIQTVGNNNKWDYDRIDSYTYAKITLTKYTFALITGYTYNGITNYTYNGITGYTYNKITGYTSNQITSYTYNLLSYSYVTLVGYTYNLITNYTYDKIISYTYAGRMYDYMAIIHYSFNKITGYTTNYIFASYSFNRISDYTYSYNAARTNVTTVIYNYVFDTGNYKMDSLGGKVLVRGNAKVIVTGSVQFTGQDGITINPGGSLKLYVETASASIGGKGVINNGGSAIDFQYYGLPSNKSVSFGGNAAFTGTIYAPQADFHLGGGGNDTYDFVGACITGPIHMNGHFNFHYDESLRTGGPSRGYVIWSWKEI